MATAPSAASRIITALRDAGSPLTIKELAQKASVTYGYARQLLPKMVRAGQVEQIHDLRYQLPEGSEGALPSLDRNAKPHASAPPEPQADESEVVEGMYRAGEIVYQFLGDGDDEEPDAALTLSLYGRKKPRTKRVSAPLGGRPS